MTGPAGPVEWAQSGGSTQGSISLYGERDRFLALFKPVMNYCACYSMLLSILNTPNSMKMKLFNAIRSPTQKEEELVYCFIKMALEMVFNLSHIRLSSSYKSNS